MIPDPSRRAEWDASQAPHDYAAVMALEARANKHREALEWIKKATDAGESDPHEMASLLSTISTVVGEALK